MINRHNWTKAEEDIILANRHLTTRELKQKFFRTANVTEVAINDKRQRVEGLEDFPESDSPWTHDEIVYLAQHIDDSNEAIQTIIPKYGKLLNQMRFDIKNRRGRARNLEPVKKLRPGHISPALDTKDMPASSSKLIIQFTEKNKMIHFLMKLRVYKSDTGRMDLIKELRDTADKLERNNKFYV